jgi:tripeptide aminopeptidase
MGKAFARAAKKVTNVAGATGNVTISTRVDYESFRLANDEPCVVVAGAVVRSIGLTPIRAVANGGLDANWTTRHGIPTVTLGCGQANPHTVSETLDLAGFENACRIALRLAADTAGKIPDRPTGD